MFPPWATAIRQSLAHGGRPYTNAFASPRRFAQDNPKALACAADGLFCDDCYPSPYPWPGPLWVRPSFMGRLRRRIAYLVAQHSFGFHLAPNAVESASIKTIIRGSVTCVNRPLFLWRFASRPFRLVLIMICSAAAWVRWAVQLLPAPSAATWPPVRLLAQALALFATILTSANKPTTSRLPPIAAVKRFKTIRANRPGGFFHKYVADGTPEGWQCSKRY